MTTLKTRTAMLAAGLVLAVSAGSAPAQAGFFDQLFGMQPMPAPQPYYAAPQPTYAQPEQAMPTRREPRHVRRRVAESKPVRQKTTDLMHDASLRPGDAVMTKNGIQVFEGDEAGHHSHDEFVALNDADVLGHREKAELIAIDTTRNDPLRHGASMGTMATGRSASVSTPIVAGYKITDARGKTVRYVGP